MNRKMREEEKEEGGREKKRKERGGRREEGKEEEEEGERKRKKKEGELRGAGPQAPPKIAFLDGLQASPGCFLCVFELLLVQSFFW